MKFNYMEDRYARIKDNPFFLEELSVISSIPDGEEYYQRIIDNVQLESNPQNSYVMFACGKIGEIDETSPCKFVEESASLPDIDVDFPPYYREKAIQDVKDKYGVENVSQVVTFSRMQGRSALKEVMSSEGIYDNDIMNEVTKDIPDAADVSDQLEEMEDPSLLMFVLENMPHLVSDYCYLDKDGELQGDFKDVFRKALRIEGTFKSQGKHAAGVIIASEPVSRYAPMVPMSKGRGCGFEMKAAEKAGLIKFDFLGVDILGKIQEVLGPDLSKYSLNDQKTLDLIATGKTKGCFQIESRLGRDWASRLAPKSMEELSDLVAIIRPGTLQSKENGKTMIQHYEDRKNEKTKVPLIHPLVDEILTSTYGIVLYQEQAMAVSRSIAGFSMAQANKLRKAIGKKDAKLMKVVKGEFIKGCIAKGIEEEVYNKVFNMIESSSRYSFNKSHALSYAFCTYFSAYCKAHHNIDFYRVWLRHAENKVKPFYEVAALVNSAKLDGVTINPPSIKWWKNDFFILDDQVYFGLRAIKGVGDKEIQKTFDIMQEIGDTITWNKLLYRLPEVNKRAVTAFIESGAMDFLEVPRTRMLHEYLRLKDLTKSEMGFLQRNNLYGLPLADAMRKVIPVKKEGGGTSSAKRSAKVADTILSSLINPGRPLTDTPSYIATVEEKLMGIPLSASYLDECADACAADSTCKEVLDGKTGKMTISVEILEVKKHTIKKEGDFKDKDMAFISAKDDTCEIDNIVIFPDAYEKYAGFIAIRNTVVFFGEQKTDSFIVSKVYQI